MSDTQYDPETLMTESSENRTVIMSENGCVSYEFTTPLVEGYGMATNPYREFRRGVDIKTFTSDTLPLTDATLRANYAIYYENQKLWEAKGNVVIYKFNRKEGDTTVVSRTEVYTQQLFWNAKTKQIYSNVDTKVLQSDGWHFGVGFDADESLKNIHFRKYMSEMEFEMEGDAAGSGTRREAHGSDEERRDEAVCFEAGRQTGREAGQGAGGIDVVPRHTGRYRHTGKYRHAHEARYRPALRGGGFDCGASRAGQNDAADTAGVATRTTIERQTHLKR